MAYTMADLLDKLIFIEEKGYEMFMNIAETHSSNEKVRTLVKVFANEEKRHAAIYEALRDNIKNSPTRPLDVALYDKAVKFIYEFSKAERKPRMENIQDVLEYCLDFEKENLALVTVIQGTLFNEEDKERQQIFTRIIAEEKKHVKNIKEIIGNNSKRE